MRGCKQQRFKDPAVVVDPYSTSNPGDHIHQSKVSCYVIEEQRCQPKRYATNLQHHTQKASKGNNEFLTELILKKWFNGFLTELIREKSTFARLKFNGINSCEHLNLKYARRASWFSWTHIRVEIPTKINSVEKLARNWLYTYRYYISRMIEQEAAGNFKNNADARLSKPQAASSKHILNNLECMPSNLKYVPSVIRWGSQHHNT